MKTPRTSTAVRWTLFGVGLALLATLPVAAQPVEVQVPEEPVADAIDFAYEELVEPTGMTVLEYSDEPSERPKEAIKLWQEQQRRLAGVNKSVPVPVSSSPIEPNFGAPTAGPSQRASNPPAQFVNRDNLNTLPAGDSHVAEMAAANNGKYTFATWNWGAARSVNNGVSWSYVNPYTTNGFSDFCCDQDVIHDKGRDVFFWLRQGVPTNGENRIMLGASVNDGASFCNYTLNSPDGMWYDYPRMILTNNKLWITWNMFNVANSWQHTRIQQWDIEDMAACTSASLSTLEVTAVFNLTGANGGTSKAYFAGHINTSSVRIYSWQEGGASVPSFVRTVPAWVSGSMSCASSNGGDACARSDHRMTGAYVKKHNALAFSPLEVVGFFWNAKENGTQLVPYIENAWFYTNTMNYGGRDYVWSNAGSFLYADAYPDVRGNVGVVVNYSAAGGAGPIVGVCKDDYTDGQPPGWGCTYPYFSSVGPTDDKWGDYNRARQFGPLGTCWLATSHYLDSGGATHPVFMVFGNGRDFEGCYQNWKQEP